MVLRRHLSTSRGRTPNHHPNQKIVQLQSERGTQIPEEIRSTPSCFLHPGIAYECLGMMTDGVLFGIDHHDDRATRLTSATKMRTAGDAADQSNNRTWFVWQDVLRWKADGGS